MFLKFLNQVTVYMRYCFFALFFLAINPNLIKAASALDLKVFPPTTYLSVKPGAGVNHQIKLKNDGLYTLEITPALVNFHSDDQAGQVILEQKSDFKYLNLDGDENKWSKSFIIKPGEEQTLNFVIALPSDAEYKEHYLSILFQAKQLLYTNDSSKDTSLSAVVVSNVILLVSVDDQNRGELTIEQFFLPKMADSFIGFNFSALVKNIGINATPVDGHIKISHWPDQNVEIYELYPDMVLAGGKRLIRAMSEEDLETLAKMEESKDIKIAAGEDYEAKKVKFINEKLKTKQFYKKSFLIGAYDLELKVGDDILQKRVIVLPFSVLLIAILLPLIYWTFNLLVKSFKKPVDLNN
ncbi:hypothetical protein KKI22_03520 [Patescibacteria group bacterium]|nr:hypothetical protein [Patescibacteria group bacterium]